MIENQKKRWKQFLTITMVLVICLGFAAFKTLHESDKAAEVSFLNSIRNELNRDSEFLLSLNSIPKNEWIELDEKNSVKLIEPMLANNSVSIGRRLRWRVERKIAQHHLSDILRIQIIIHENGFCQARVIAPGSRFDSSNDLVFE